MKTGYFCRGQQVQAATVSDAVTAVGQKIFLAHQLNPTKLTGPEKLLPRLSEMMAGWAKEDPSTMKKQPVEPDVPELLSNVARSSGATELTKAVGDSALTAIR